MWACRYGIAFFENTHDNGLNYNLTIEVGGMLLSGRRCALLKDQTVPAMPTDLVGQIYKSVDLVELQPFKEPFTCGSAMIWHWEAARIATKALDPRTQKTFHGSSRQSEIVDVGSPTPVTFNSLPLETAIRRVALRPSSSPERDVLLGCRA